MQGNSTEGRGAPGAPSHQHLAEVASWLWATQMSVIRLDVLRTRDIAASRREEDGERRLRDEAALAVKDRGKLTEASSARLMTLEVRLSKEKARLSRIEEAIYCHL